MRVPIPARRADDAQGTPANRCNRWERNRCAVRVCGAVRARSCAYRSGKRRRLVRRMHVPHTGSRRRIEGTVPHVNECNKINRLEKVFHERLPPRGTGTRTCREHLTIRWERAGVRCVYPALFEACACAHRRGKHLSAWCAIRRARCTYRIPALGAGSKAMFATLTNSIKSIAWKSAS